MSYQLHRRITSSISHTILSPTKIVKRIVLNFIVRIFLDVHKKSLNLILTSSIIAEMAFISNLTLEFATVF